MVLDEAKILCTPILATAYPTVADQISHGQEGYITPMTPEGIAQGVQTLLEEPERIAGMRSYLDRHEYGNQWEVKKYIELLDA